MIDKDIRNKILKEISKYIPSDIDEKIEQGIVTFSEEYAETNGTPFLLEQIYQTKGEELIELFKSKNLQYIINKLKSEDFKPEKIAFMTKDELNPELASMEKNNVKGTEGLVDCPKCTKSNVKLTELQLKRGDEPTDIFATCQECGHVFMI